MAEEVQVDAGQVAADAGAENAGAAPAGEGGVRIGKRCFVGNLAWRTSWQDLKVRAMQTSRCASPLGRTAMPIL
jgi:hypothetical protein